MAIPTYTPGYPPDGSSLGQTKSVIRNNLDGTFLTLNVDHVNNNGEPGSNPAGYHTIIHEVSQRDVSTVMGVNQVFSGVPGLLDVNMITTPAIPGTGDTQLYSLSGAGVLSQLTGSQRSTSGFAWTGGILLQWGRVTYTGAGSAQSFSFPATFPNNAFTVTVQSQTNNIKAFAQANIVNASQFQIISNGDTGSNIIYYFNAIGY